MSRTRPGDVSTPGHERHSKPFNIVVDGGSFEWEDDYITAAQVCALVAHGSNYVALLAEHGHEPQKTLSDHKRIYLGNQHTHHFVTKLK